jgi:CRP-like cAMP-binding protein
LQAIVRLHIRIAMGFMGQSVACNARHKVDARLSRWLLTCSDYRSDCTLPLTQEFIAAMLGVRRTTVTDVATDLQEAGIIAVRRGNVEILDRAKLLGRACECYSVTRGRIDAAIGTPTAS